VAIFKHRDIEAVMPPEVRRRANRGVGKGKVDWYAGRRHQPDLTADSTSEREPTDFTNQMRKARREVRQESAAARREQVSHVARAAASRPQRILTLVVQRLHRCFSDALTRHA
jgi:hypothetical protein